MARAGVASRSSVSGRTAVLAGVAAGSSAAVVAGLVAGFLSYRVVVVFSTSPWTTTAVTTGGALTGVVVGVGTGVGSGLLAVGTHRLMPGTHRTALVGGSAGLATGLSVALMMTVTDWLDSAWREQSALSRSLGVLLYVLCTAWAAGAYATRCVDVLRDVVVSIAAVRRHQRYGVAALAARQLACAAAALAGPRRRHLREAWLADLLGTSEHDPPMSGRRPLVHASGLVLAAVRLRFGDLAASAERRLDWVLFSEQRTCAVVGTVVGLMSLYLLRTLGLLGLVTNAENVVMTGIGLYGAARLLRQARGTGRPRR